MEAQAGAARTRALAASRLLSRVIFAGLLAVVTLAPVPYGTVEPWSEGAYEAAVFGLAALWMVEGALSGRWLVREHLLVAAPAALAALALLQTLAPHGGVAASYDPYSTWLAALKLLAHAAAFALLLRYTTTRRRLFALLGAVALVGLGSSLFGLARQAAQGTRPGFLLPLLRPGSGYAQFINKNHFAFAAEMTLGLLLGLAAGAGVRRGKALVPVALAIPVWAALVLSNSRGGVLAMLCQLTFLGAAFGVSRAAVPAQGRGRVRGHALARVFGSAALRVMLVGALLVTAVVGMVWLGGDPFADRVASVGEEAVASDAGDLTRAGRKHIWAATREVFEERPFIGVGLGAYWVAVTRHHRGSGALVPQEAHNDYLELLACGGVVGGVIVLVGIVIFARRARVALAEGDSFRRAAALGALTGIVGVAVHSLVDFGLHVTANALLLVALAAAASARVSEVKARRESPASSPKN